MTIANKQMFKLGKYNHVHTFNSELLKSCRNDARATDSGGAPLRMNVTRAFLM